MNKEALMNELNGQFMRLIEAYRRKESFEKEIQNKEKEILDKKKEIELEDLAIKDLNSIINTLQIILTTDGFEKMDELQNLQSQMNNPEGNR